MYLFCTRTNLDPWDQHSDSEIWDALEKTHIKDMVIDEHSVLSNHALLN